jgi:hypothetical protein
MAVVRKIHFLFLFVLLGCISFAHAISFELNAIPIKDKIEVSEEARFKLEIINNDDEMQTFRVYALDYPIWNIQTDPIINPILVDVAPHSKESILLVVDPLDVKNIMVGPHLVNVKVRSKTTNEALGIPLKISVISRESLIEGYVPTVVTSAKIPNKINPREEIPIRITLNNQNIINYSNLTIKIDSNLIKKVINVELGPNEEKSVTFREKLNPLTPPQKDNFIVTVLLEGKVISGPVAAPLEVIEYASKEKEDIRKQFLKTVHDITFSSNNKNYSGVIKIETSFFRSLFSSTKPKAKIMQEGNKRYFVWAVELDENNSMSVRIIEDYRMLFFVIIVAIILVFVYFKYRSPITINKEAKNIIKKDGGIFSLKIVLHLKNRGNKKIEGIELREVVPNIAEIEKDISIGTLKPSKILKHEKKGSIIKWDIDSLDVGEERVLSYKIKAKLPILGDLNLPPAVAKFRYNNKDAGAHSNREEVS